RASRTRSHLLSPKRAPPGRSAPAAHLLLPPLSPSPPSAALHAAHSATQRPPGRPASCSGSASAIAPLPAARTAHPDVDRPPTPSSSPLSATLRNSSLSPPSPSSPAC